MSRRPIAHSPDLQRLENEGYTIEIVGGKLIVRDIPYVDGGGTVHPDGFLAMALELAGDVARPPSDHTITFGGGIPCTSAGSDLTTVVNSRGPRDLGDGIIVACTCSMKPIETGSYPDFYEKVTKYVAAIAGHATALDPRVTAAAFRPVVDDAAGGPFKYANTASSRVGIDALNAKLRGEQVAIVGLGGTGVYILDFVAKTEVDTIHVYDADEFRSHNAFRAPGAATLNSLNDGPLKVEHFVGIYTQMRDGIIAHPYRIDETNVEELQTMTFVFIAVDDAAAKDPIASALVAYNVPFVDAGMGVEMIDGHLTGSLRTTLVTPEKNDHVAVRIPTVGVARPNDYGSNIQVAELNARNATDAVIAWKQYRGFYADMGTEHSSVYSIATNHIINEDQRIDKDNPCG